MAQLFSNSAITSVGGSGSINSTDTTLSVVSGSAFPAPGASDFFQATLYELDGSNNEVGVEIVKVTANSGPTFTIVRGQEGTTNIAHPTVGGRTVYVELRWTATGATGMLQKDNVGPFINAATSKATPVDADELAMADSAASNVLKKLTWANLKAAIKAYYDGVTATLTGKTINLASNTVSATRAQMDAACSDGDFVFQSQAASVTTLTTSGNSSLGGVVSRATPGVLTTTTGAVTIDWSTNNNYKQNEPTGNITYTFTAPPGPAHLQLFIDSDGTTTARTFAWPGSVIWLGSTWAHTANKKAFINFWYDGTNYYAQGVNQV